MDEKTLLRYELRADVFKALAHPMRILMLEKLNERPWCVCELARDLGLEKSVASKHLSLLKNVGLITDEKRGTMVEYRLQAPCVLDVILCTEKIVLDNRRTLLDIVSKA